jgi:hypothetical protein
VDQHGRGALFVKPEQGARDRLGVLRRCAGLEQEVVGDPDRQRDAVELAQLGRAEQLVAGEPAQLGDGQGALVRGRAAHDLADLFVLAADVLDRRPEWFVFAEAERAGVVVGRGDLGEEPADGWVEFVAAGREQAGGDERDPGVGLGGVELGRERGEPILVAALLGLRALVGLAAERACTGEREREDQRGRERAAAHRPHDNKTHCAGRPNSA